MSDILCSRHLGATLGVDIGHQSLRTVPNPGISPHRTQERRLQKRFESQTTSILVPVHRGQGLVTSSWPSVNYSRLGRDYTSARIHARRPGVRSGAHIIPGAGRENCSLSGGYTRALIQLDISIPARPRTTLARADLGRSTGRNRPRHQSQGGKTEHRRRSQRFRRNSSPFV